MIRWPHYCGCGPLTLCAGSALEIGLSDRFAALACFGCDFLDIGLVEVGHLPIFHSLFLLQTDIRSRYRFSFPSGTLPFTRPNSRAGSPPLLCLDQLLPYAPLGQYHDLGADVLSLLRHLDLAISDIWRWR